MTIQKLPTPEEVKSGYAVTPEGRSAVRSARLEIESRTSRPLVSEKVITMRTNLIY